MSTKHDSYCWECSKMGTNLKCNNCIRSFHSDCANEIDGNVVNPGEWLCSVCVTMKASEDTDKIKELKVLPILIERIRSEKAFKALNSSMAVPVNSVHNLTESIVNPINMNDVIASSQNYTSLNQFYFDICWIVHNCAVLYTDGNETTKQAKSLLKYIANEIDGLRNCAECYINKIKRPKMWYKLLCSEPHLIIWAKDENDFYWPAKVFAVEGQQVNIQFFGHHKSGSVSAANCYLYSKSISQPTNASNVWYHVAMKEANIYVGRICKKYGSFEYAETATTFDPALLQKYVRQMMPGIVEHRRLALDGNQESFDVFENTINLDSDDNGDEVDTEQSQLEHLHNLVIPITSNEDESPLRSQTEEAFRTENEPFILLKQIYDLNSASNENANLEIQQSEDMSGDSNEPPRKKVRFSDEFGKDLTKVRYFDAVDSVQEDEQNDVPVQAEDSDPEDSTMDIDNPIATTGECLSTNNPLDSYSTVKTIQKYMEKIQSEMKNVESLISELKKLKEVHAHCQLKSNEFIGQLNAVKYERDQAVSEAKENSAVNEALAKAISELTQSHNKKMADLKLKADNFANERSKGEESLQKMKDSYKGKIEHLETVNAERHNKIGELHDEIKTIKESYRMEISEKSFAHEQMMDRLKVQLQDKEAEIARIKEEQTKQGLTWLAEVNFIKNIFEK